MSSSRHWHRSLCAGLIALLATSSAAAAERWEVVGSAAAQVNGGGSEHIQFALDGSFALHERLRLHLALSPLVNWQTKSLGSKELALNASSSQMESAPVLLRELVTLGIEGVPLKGNATFLSLPLGLQLFLRVDGGVATSRVQLQEAAWHDGSPTYGSTGLAQALGGSIGLRAQHEKWVFRLFASTLATRLKRDKVNGCNFVDLQVVAGKQTESQPSGGCDADAFTDRQTDATIASQIVGNAADPRPRWTTLVMLGLAVGKAF